MKGIQIKLTQKGNFDKLEKFLKKMSNKDFTSILEKYGRKGVQALESATPVLTGKTASSWTYEIQRSGQSAIIYWKNTNVNKGVNIALILQYGHGTGTGGYVEGRDYINPAIRPIFDSMSDAIWKEVISA